MDTRLRPHTKLASDLHWYEQLLLPSIGLFMTVLDSTIVNVALPLIGGDLRFSETSLVWIINGYLVLFGGLLPLFGRLGDYLGHRHLFFVGVGLFCCTSMVCGLSESAEMLVVGRTLQGGAAALVSAVSIPLAIQGLHTPPQRARALGTLTSVSIIGASSGLLIGGLLTKGLSWRWVFLVNVPLSILIYILGSILPNRADEGTRRGHLDVGGSISITASIMLAMLALLSASAVGSLSNRTLLYITGALFSFVAFLYFERRTSDPVLPFALFANRNFTVGIIVGTFWAAAEIAWFYFCPLYMERILKYDSLEVGVSFLPAQAIMATMFITFSGKIVHRFGSRSPIVAGLFLIAAGLELFAHAPVHGTYMRDVLPGMLLLGIGCGIAYNPLLFATLDSVNPSDQGVASGVAGASTVMGAALALALLSSIAASWTNKLLAESTSTAWALNSGYHVSLRVGAIMTCAAGLTAMLFLRIERNHASNRAA